MSGTLFFAPQLVVEGGQSINRKTTKGAGPPKKNADADWGHEAIRQGSRKDRNLIKEYRQGRFEFHVCIRVGLQEFKRSKLCARVSSEAGRFEVVHDASDARIHLRTSGQGDWMEVPVLVSRVDSVEQPKGVKLRPSSAPVVVLPSFVRLNTLDRSFDTSSSNISDLRGQESPETGAIDGDRKPGLVGDSAIPLDNPDGENVESGSIVMSALTQDRAPFEPGRSGEMEAVDALSFCQIILMRDSIRLAVQVPVDHAAQPCGLFVAPVEFDSNALQGVCHHA
jgi:hypothetical protein